MAREQPYGAFKFQLEIQGMDVAGFAEVSGLDVTTEVIEYREGDDETTISKLPGLPKYGNVTLKRGVVASNELWEWYQTVLDGSVERKGVRIKLLDKDAKPLSVWQLDEAWPCRYVGPIFDARISAVAIEAIELCHQRLDRIQ